MPEESHERRYYQSFRPFSPFSNAEALEDGEAARRLGLSADSAAVPLQKEVHSGTAAFVIKGEVYGQRPKVLDMPVEWIMHTIREMTQEWDPAEKTSVHRWKILYMTLLRLEYFRIEKKHRYADFVKAVVKYCFPEVPDSYSNNISKSSLSEHFSDWTVDEKALYNTLKEALTFLK